MRADLNKDNKKNENEPPGNRISRNGITSRYRVLKGGGEGETQGEALQPSLQPVTCLRPLHFTVFNAALQVACNGLYS